MALVVAAVGLVGNCVCENVGSVKIPWTKGIPPGSSGVTFT